mmetsp:Transcript_12831/g.53779  ORF Transcript_12831/g.53779 Transcript_12831/m.53779 type:complete len:218 (+) Transcript_12831:848-1501(+)
MRTEPKTLGNLSGMAQSYRYVPSPSRAPKLRSVGSKFGWSSFNTRSRCSPRFNTSVSLHARVELTCALSRLTATFFVPPCFRSHANSAPFSPSSVRCGPRPVMTTGADREQNSRRNRASGSSEQCTRGTGRGGGGPPAGGSATRAHAAACAARARVDTSSKYGLPSGSAAAAAASRASATACRRASSACTSGGCSISAAPKRNALGKPRTTSGDPRR